MALRSLSLSLAPSISSSPLDRLKTSSRAKESARIHRDAIRCVSRILACGLLPRDGCRFTFARFSPPLYIVDGGANGDRLAFLPVGRFLCLSTESSPFLSSLFLPLSRFLSHFRTHLLPILPPPIPIPTPSRVSFLGTGFLPSRHQTESKREGCSSSKYSPVVISRKTPFFSPETEEILTCIYIYSIAGARGEEAESEVRGNEAWVG